MDFGISEWIHLDFRVDFWISVWISADGVQDFFRDGPLGHPGTSGHLPAKCGHLTTSKAIYLGVYIDCGVLGLQQWTAHWLCLAIYPKVNLNVCQFRNVLVVVQSSHVALKMATFSITFGHPALYSINKHCLPVLRYAQRELNMGNYYIITASESHTSESHTSDFNCNFLNT